MADLEWKIQVAYLLVTIKIFVPRGYLPLRGAIHMYKIV